MYRAPTVIWAYQRVLSPIRQWYPLRSRGSGQSGTVKINDMEKRMQLTKNGALREALTHPTSYFNSGCALSWAEGVPI